MKLSTLTSIVAQANASFPAAMGIDPDVCVIADVNTFHQGDLATLSPNVTFSGDDGIINEGGHSVSVPARVMFNMVPNI